MRSVAIRRDKEHLEPLTGADRRIGDHWKSAVNGLQDLDDLLPGYSILLYRPYEGASWIRVWWNERLHDVIEPGTHMVALEGKDLETGRPIPGDAAMRKVPIPDFLQNLVEEFCELTDPLIKKQNKSAAEQVASVTLQAAREHERMTHENEQLQAENEELKRQLALLQSGNSNTQDE